MQLTHKIAKEIKSNKPAHQPRFKKKNRSRDSFYIANDKFYLNEATIRLPKIGIINMFWCGFKTFISL